MGKKKQKVVLPPELPPEIPDDEVEVSDDDLQFIKENRNYASLLSTLDSFFQSSVTLVGPEYLGLLVPDTGLSWHVTRVADAKEDALEKLYEKRMQKNALKKEKEETGLQVDRVDALPIKTLNEKSITGQCLGSHNSAATKTVSENDLSEEGTAEDANADEVKLKKIKKEAKKQGREVAKAEVEETPQAAVLAEVKEDLTAEEAFESKKSKLAELGDALLTDPESNVKFLKEMVQLSKDNDHTIVKLGLLSLLAVFKDIVPGYRIRLPTEKELEMKVSKTVRRCDKVLLKLCWSAVKSLFTNEGKYGGEVTVEAVRLIADYVKAYNCQLHPDSVDVFLSLSFNEDLLKSGKTEEDQKLKDKKRKHFKASNQLVENDRKKSRQELISKTREEVEVDYKAASFAQDVIERKQMQTETLSSVLGVVYIACITSSRENIANAEALSAAVEPLPLLAPCLKGLAKFSHLIDLDFMDDLMNHLKVLASGSSNSGNTSVKCSKCLTVSERLQCCIVAFRVMRNNLHALNVDLQDFFMHLYNLVLEYRPGSLCSLVIISLNITLTRCMPKLQYITLVTVKHLLQKNVKCRNLLENDIGGGSVSGTIPKYLPYSTDPILSGALTSVLWELNLLSSHYHPAISTLASGISTMSTAHNQVLLSKSSPQLAFKEMSLDQELCFTQQSGSIKLNNKRRRTNGPATSRSIGSTTVMSSFDDNELQRKLISHFMVHHDIKENERLRKELDRTALSLQLYEQY
uniref:CCAAT-binding factor domain-containing protein n=1 Tax=Phaseolus vulgaris TaxID=3885 RepID=V7AG05_PHAVU|nr:hypothetical protein PHAVU_011G073300g [Phaseolus vulgaris]ESW04180.1 hypothetical protein PHAVU_011G073300g [Phaseolus vulgaris]